MEKTRLLRNIYLLCASLVGLVATLVFIGYLVADMRLVGLHLGPILMHPNTAICLMLVSFALVLQEYDKATAASLIVLGALVIGVLTLAGHIPGMPFNIDAFTAHLLSQVNGLSDRRIVTNTALAIILTSIAILLCHPVGSRGRERMLLTAVLGSLIIALASVPLISYSQQIQVLTPLWSNFTLMAVSTALCFVLVGIGLILNVWRRSNNLTWLPIPVWIGLMATTLLLASAVHTQENLKFNMALKAEADYVASKINIRLQSIYGSLDRMARRWNTADGLAPALWEDDATAYLAGFPAITALSMTDTESRIVDIVPLRPEQRVAGFRLDSEPKRAAAIQQLMLTHQPQVTSALNLKTGELGFLHINELLIKGQYAGLQIAALTVDRLFRSSLNADEWQRYAVTVEEDGATIFKSLPNNKIPPGQWHESSAVANGPFTWNVTVEPTPAFLAARNSMVSIAVLLVGFMTALLVSLCIHLALRWRGNLRTLQTAQTLNQAILVNAGSLIIATDVKGTIIGFNSAAEQLLGYCAAEIIDKHTPALWHDGGEIVQRAAELSEESGSLIEPGFEVFVIKTSQGAADTHEWTFISKDGHRFPVSLTVTALFNEKGDITGYMGIGQDITKQKQQQQALQLSEETFRLAMENAAIGMALVSPSGKWLRVNDAICDLLGYNRQDLLHTDIRSVTHPDDMESSWQNVAKLLSGVISSYSAEKRYFHRDGRVVWVQLNVSLVRNPNGTPNYMIAQIQDVTARKAVEQMKDEFISVVSHELRTPLTSIRGSLGLIAGAMAKDLPPQVNRLVDIAHKNSERLILLINDILDIDTIAAGKMRFDLKRHALAPLLEQAIDANRDYALKFNVSLALGPVPPEIAIMVDADRLAQALANLLSNAAKFSPTNGVVQVTVAHRADKIRISVRDHGGGIPEEFRNRIFGKFLQADSSVRREKGGTGLGLHITQQIINHMEGQIGFDTVLGEGTVFWLDFPNPDIKAATAPAPIVPIVTTKGRVLICEDDPDVGAILCMQIESAGFAVDTAPSIAAARWLVGANTYVAMTLDLMFPEENGMDFVHELRRNPATAQLPIVIVSARADEEKKALNGDAFGVVDWLTKPFDENRLVTALQQAVDTRNARPRILHVEDDGDLSRVLAAALDGQVDLVNAPTLRDAREKLAESTFSLIILDLGLPDGNGMSLLTRLSEYTSVPVPVLILSADEIRPNLRADVAGAMVKSRMSETKIVETILSFIPGSVEMPHD